MIQRLILSLVLVLWPLPVFADVDFFGDGAYNCVPIESTRPENWGTEIPAAIDVMQSCLFGPYTGQKFKYFCIVSKVVNGGASAWIVFFNSSENKQSEGFYLRLDDMNDKQVSHIAKVSTGGEAVTMKGTLRSTLRLVESGQGTKIAMETIADEQHRSFFVFSARSSWRATMVFKQAPEVSREMLGRIADQITGKIPQSFTIE